MIMAKKLFIDIKGLYSKLSLRTQLLTWIILIICVLGAALIISLSKITEVSIFSEIPMVEVIPTVPLHPNAEEIPKDPNPTIVIDVESIQSAALYRLSSKLKKALLITVSSVFVLGIMATIWLSRFITDPMKNLTQKLTLVEIAPLSESHESMHTQELTELQAAVKSSLERFEKQFEKQNQFVLDTAHELATPVAAVRMNIDVAALNPSPSTNDYVILCQTIDRSTIRLEKLLDQLRTIFRRGNQIQASNVNLSHLLEETIEVLMPLARTRNVEIKNYFPLGIYQETEPLFVQTMLTNLIENAIKYNVEGGKVVITANINRLGCVFIIEDTGIGISEDEIARVFDRFYRIDKSRSRHLGGTGLGLSIVQSLLNRLGGHVSIQSELGTGTTVKAFIPNYQTICENHEDDKGEK
jgi:signal transduction histidine kinase